MQGNITDWGKEVKKGLIERGWSINDLAERIGKSRTRVSGVVNGRIYSDSIASAISDLLNIEKASASMKEATRDWCMDARKAMIDLDMNTAELAEKTGYSTQYLNAIICGRYGCKKPDQHPCKYFSAEDMQNIVNKAMFYVSYYTTYCNALNMWIKSVTKPGDLDRIQWGAKVPEEFQNEVLKDYMKTIASGGIA